ncbi:MAG TPA: hypothetical protein VK390_02390 [Propionibacteriaceae bacterium]|nr:hypothetical protein [Propionibacteriaceae bacterium]
MQVINQAETSVVRRGTQRPENATPGDQERRPEEDNVGEPGVRRRGDGGRHQPAGMSVEMVRDGSGADLLLRMARGADQQLR